MELVRKKTPEEREIDKKQAEFTQIQNILSQKELDLTTIKIELRIFECEYIRSVGIRYAELDRLEALITEARSAQFPTDRSARHRANDSRARAEQSAHEAEASQPVMQQPEFKTDDDIKKLYRELAKLVHPDLALDEDDRTRRHAIMSEVNQAYSSGDKIRLQTIFDEHIQNSKSNEARIIGAELINIIRKIAQVEERLEQIETESVTLQNSDLFKLYRRIEKAKTQGQDLLAEMANDVVRSIDANRQILAELKGTKP